MATTNPREKPVCVYCRAAPGVEGEHVFPASWYPDTTPSELRWLKVPACRPCNQNWKKVEDWVGSNLVMVADLTRPEASGVLARLSKSYRADLTNDPVERKHRLTRAEKILRTTHWVDATPGAPQVLIRSEAGLYIRASPTRAIEKPGLNALAEKFIRGFHYAATGELFGDLEVKATFVHDRGPQPPEPENLRLLQMMADRPFDTRVAPGLLFRHYAGNPVSNWTFVLWGSLVILAFVKATERPAT